MKAKSTESFGSKASAKGWIMYKPVLLTTVAVVEICKLSIPNVARVNPVESSGTSSTVIVAVKAGNNSPYFLDLLSATILTTGWCTLIKYNESEQPPSNPLG